uniref:hypothetical protein n=1 Tax=Brucella melitensis TaxID=29459 RepID=UPI001AEE0924
VLLCVGVWGVFVVVGDVLVCVLGGVVGGFGVLVLFFVGLFGGVWGFVLFLGVLFLFFVGVGCWGFGCWCVCCVVGWVFGGVVGVWVGWCLVRCVAGAAV